MSVRTVCMKCMNAYQPGEDHSDVDCQRLQYYQLQLQAERKKTEIRLDAYEIANLGAALELIATAPQLSAMNTGDWVRQIQAKLPATDTLPNQSPRRAAAHPGALHNGCDRKPEAKDIKPKKVFVVLSKVAVPRGPVLDVFTTKEGAVGDVKERGPNSYFEEWETD